MIGELLGHYRIGAQIGEGGMGAYRGHDEILHRDLALKVVKKDDRLDSAAGKTYCTKRALLPHLWSRSIGRKNDYFAPR